MSVVHQIIAASHHSKHSFHLVVVMNIWPAIASAPLGVNPSAWMCPSGDHKRERSLPHNCQNQCRWNPPQCRRCTDLETICFSNWISTVWQRLSSPDDLWMIPIQSISQAIVHIVQSIGIVVWYLWLATFKAAFTFQLNAVLNLFPRWTLYHFHSTLKVKISIHSQNINSKYRSCLNWTHPTTAWDGPKIIEEGNLIQRLIWLAF